MDKFFILSYNMKEIYYKYYKNTDIIWEDKAIILGLIYYLMENYTEYRKKTILIKNKLYCEILNKLFNNINFNEKEGIYINIKNNCEENLCINYLDNISMDYNYIYILPWNNYDNPLILITKGINKFDRNYINEKIQILKYYFERKIAYKFESLEIIDYNYCMNNYYLERYILRNFCKQFTKKINYKKIRKYINKKLIPIPEYKLPNYEITFNPHDLINRTLQYNKPDVKIIEKVIEKPVYIKPEQRNMTELFNTLNWNLKSISKLVEK